MNKPDVSSIATVLAETSFEVPLTSAKAMVRTSIVIPKTMDNNLEVCRLKLGVSKNDTIKKAISEFLTKQGFDPDRIPKNFRVSY